MSIYIKLENLEIFSLKSICFNQQQQKVDLFFGCVKQQQRTKLKTKLYILSLLL